MLSRWLVLGSCVAVVAFALTGYADEGVNELFVAAVRGEITAGGGLALFVEAGAPVTYGLRVYSEPSHTLLLLMVDSEYSRTASGEAWLAGFDGEAIQSKAAVLKTALPSARPRVELRGRPQDDTRIALWVNGTWPDGSTQDLLVADGQVGGSAFSFRAGFVLDKEASLKVWPPGGGSYHHCCEGTGCSQMCVTCSGPQFSCCILDSCCDIFCGWAGSCCAG